ncbi:hypothetical protein [Escherichia coli]|uniref:hypothetical protein n=1 Tax=Escherichia coli TaxID=562 RepID=UPI00295EFB69|nr:hypothetical protein [Escherichia coli]
MNTAAEAIRALSMQMPGFRRQMNEGWYQIRIAGDDTAPEAVYARLHEQLGEGTVIHIVPRLAGAGKGGLQPYGEMLVGSRRISQDISTRDEGGGGKVVVIGRQG